MPPILYPVPHCQIYTHKRCLRIVVLLMEGTTKMAAPIIRVLRQAIEKGQPVFFDHDVGQFRIGPSTFPANTAVPLDCVPFEEVLTPLSRKSPYKRRLLFAIGMRAHYRMERRIWVEKKSAKHK